MLNCFDFQFYVTADHLNAAIIIVFIAAEASSRILLYFQLLVSIVPVKNIKLELVVDHFY